jgi:hypothetical protein
MVTWLLFFLKIALIKLGKPDFLKKSKNLKTYLECILNEDARELEFQTALSFVNV